MIRVTNLGHRRGNNQILSGLTLEVPPGRLAAIVGRSGSGKTTLLRCLVGLEPFEEGEVEVDGVVLRAVEAMKPAERMAAIVAIRERLGLVFQAYELFPHLSALDNCTLAPIHVKGSSRGDAERIARAQLERLGLSERAASYPDRLSGGERQRVAIARALAMEPRYLLYDEPTSALDPSLKVEMRDTLRRVAETGVTQVLVTHELPIARAASLVFVLEAGRIVEQGEPGQVLSAPSHRATRELLALDITPQG
jgi:ABC-type polar amino acid transport system ATPase subunit